MNKSKNNENSANALDTLETDNYGINTILNIFNTSASDSDAKKFCVEILIEGKKQLFEVDSGAGFTLIPENEFNRLGIKSQPTPTNVAFRTYT